jgi:hypothetical protein
MLDDFGGALEPAHFADSGDVLPVPFDAEFEVLVRVEAICVDAKLSHNSPP